MTRPPASRPEKTAGMPATPTIQVRLFPVCRNGQLISQVPEVAAAELVLRGWAKWEGRGRRIHLQISNDAPLASLSRMGERPDLDRMRRDDPKRHAAFWRGTVDARTGQGAVGRSIADSNTQFSTGRTGERPRVPLVQFECCIKIDERSPWSARNGKLSHTGADITSSRRELVEPKRAPRICIKLNARQAWSKDNSKELDTIPDWFMPQAAPISKVVGLRRWLDGAPARVSEPAVMPRFCVRADPDLPWSEANARPVF
jgi:hypothetical protein